MAQRAQLAYEEAQAAFEEICASEHHAASEAHPQEVFAEPPALCGPSVDPSDAILEGKIPEGIVSAHLQQWALCEGNAQTLLVGLSGACQMLPAGLGEILDGTLLERLPAAIEPVFDVSEVETACPTQNEGMFAVPFSWISDPQRRDR